MSTFLALRKKTRVATQANRMSLSVRERRAQLATDSPSPELAERLIGQGFQQVSPREGTLDEPASTFLHLKTIDAYVLRTPFEHKMERVQETCADSAYHLFPDAQLSLPRPISTEHGQPLARPTGGQSPWPVESGIHEAHRHGVTGEGVLVGVLDTGCDADHSELLQKPIAFGYIPPNSRDRVRQVRGFDVQGHGTHVCGILAGKNVGVAPGVDVVVAGVIESETRQSSLRRVAQGLDWMLSHFQRPENLRKPAIVSLSLGVNREGMNDFALRQVMDGIRVLLSLLFEDFAVLPIVAIGNDGAGTMSAPGYFPEPLSVGAVDFNHVPAAFSGGGRSPLDGHVQPNIAGYGVQVYSSLERDWQNTSRWQRRSGTSMATPYVAGIAALSASAEPGLEGAALRTHLLDTALPLRAPADRVGTGLARFGERFI